MKKATVVFMAPIKYSGYKPTGSSVLKLQSAFGNADQHSKECSQSKLLFTTTFRNADWQYENTGFEVEQDTRCVLWASWSFADIQSWLKAVSNPNDRQSHGSGKATPSYQVCQLKHNYAVRHNWKPAEWHLWPAAMVVTCCIMKSNTHVSCIPVKVLCFHLNFSTIFSPQVEPSTKLFPAVFAKATSPNVFQFELGRFKVRKKNH